MPAGKRPNRDDELQLSDVLPKPAQQEEIDLGKMKVSKDLFPKEPTPASDRELEPELEPLRISAWMYLRTIGLLVWSVIRHPLATTYIDMASGEVVHVPPGQEVWEQAS